MRWIIALLFVFVISYSYGQRSDYGSQTQTHQLTSQEGKTYTIKVTLPSNYDESQTYETLYYLDGWWLAEIVMGSYAILNLSERIDDVILVGISTEGKSRDWHLQRNMDYTPSPYDIDIMGIEMKAGKGKDLVNLDKSNTGGADVFISFLESKVFTLVKEQYSTGEKNGLLGHSFAGLFCLYVMQQQPALFSDYIIISPSLWWNKREIVKEELFADFKDSHLSYSVYLTYGDLESKLISRSNTQMDSILTGLEKDQLDYQFTIHGKTNHNSILSRGIYDGLLYTYGK